MKKENGFTLVELAIVLMIIGLLIGGVLRGQELLNNARITATIKQIDSYRGAMNTFMDIYGSMPGDFALADTRLPGCTAANNCQHGDGDGLVGARDNVWNPNNQAINNENTQFWKHLALSHLISGVDPSSATPAIGKSHPAAEFSGVYTVLQTLDVGTTANNTGQFSMAGLVLRMHGGITEVEASPIVSPKQTAQLDRKMDDGIPFTGDVQASAAGNGGLADGCELAYDETRDDKFCVPVFMMKR